MRLITLRILAILGVFSLTSPGARGEPPSPPKSSFILDAHGKFTNGQAVRIVRATPDGRTVISVGANNSIRAWSRQSRELLWELRPGLTPVD